MRVRREASASRAISGSSRVRAFSSPSARTSTRRCSRASRADEHARDVVGCWRCERGELGNPAGARLVEVGAVQCQGVEVEIQIHRGPEALDEGDGTALFRLLAKLSAGSSSQLGVVLDEAGRGPAAVAGTCEKRLELALHGLMEQGVLGTPRLVVRDLGSTAGRSAPESGLRLRRWHVDRALRESCPFSGRSTKGNAAVRERRFTQSARRWYARVVGLAALQPHAERASCDRI